jgi:hypothetical protein
MLSKILLASDTTCDKCGSPRINMKLKIHVLSNDYPLLFKCCLDCGRRCSDRLYWLTREELI